MAKLKKHTTLLFILGILIFSFFSWRYLLKPGYFSMHDDMQVMRIFEMDKCIKDGQIPCRWVPDLGYSYGYPLFNYYPSLPYYIGEAFHLLGFSIIDSVKILFFLGFVLSGIFMFFLAREFWGDWGGFLSALFYIYAPYHAVDVYVRGAMAEHWGLVWFPLVFLAIYKIIKKGGLVWIILLAISYGFLLLSHNIMSMLWTVVSAAWGLLWLFLTKSYKKIIPLAVGVVWAIAVASFFLLPVLVEKKFVHTETMLMGYFNYLAHFVSLKQLFLKTDWGWGASVYGSDDMMPFMIGIIHWALVALSSFLAFLFWRRKKNRSLLLTVLFLTAFFLLTAFMTHQRSTFIWQKVKILEYLQFPWRFLGLVIFFASFLSGAVICFLRGKTLKILAILILFFGLVFSTRVYFQPEEHYTVTDSDRLSGKQWQLALTNAIFDYLPVYATYPPADEAPKQPQIISGEAQISQFEKGTNWQKFKIKVDKEATVQLPLYDFPNWTVWLDGQKVKTNHENFLGLVTFVSPPGEHKIQIKLLDTPIRKVGNLLSAVGFLAIPGSLIWLKRKRE